MKPLKDAYRQVLPVRTPATKAELLQRLKQRQTPAPELHLTPNGPETSEVNRNVNSMNERRIADLTERLETMRKGAEQDFSLAKTQGLAKTNFDRSR